MPASSSETRTKWRKRKREPLVSRKGKQDDDVFEEEDDEDDPEVDEDLHPNPSSSADRTATIGRDRQREWELVSEGGERISEFPLAVKRVVSRPHSSVFNIAAMERAGQSGESRGAGQSVPLLENISYGQLQALSAMPADSLDDGSYVITPPNMMPGRGVIKRFGSAGRVHVVPIHADWFSPNTVHRLERQVVPHFFSGKSADNTPEKYMECRNYIVAKYMENPDKHLSVADCQGLVAGTSADDVARIMRFLDHWGLINYCASLPDFEPQKAGTYLSEDSNGDLCVPAAALKSIDSLIQFDKPKCRLKAKDIYPQLASYNDEESDFDNRIREHLSENQCNFCSRRVPVVYFQSQKEIDIMLCSDCYHEGRFVAGHSSLDFVKINSMKDYGDLDAENWTDQETLLLLEGMQLYNENWNEIAEHVGTKSKAQCILHFVRLPVDGTPIANIEVPIESVSSDWNKKACERSQSSSNGNLAGSGFQELDESKFPFGNCGNPVMALVAFLASAVGPRVAAACAHASLAALSKDDDVTASGNVGPKDGSGCNNNMNMEGKHGKEGGTHGDTTRMGHQKGSSSQHDPESPVLSAEKVKAAALVGLAAAATKAKLFADHEEREIQRLSANIINHQLKRLELKLKQFAEVETLLMRECEQLERTRQRIASDRAVMMTQLGSAGFSRPMGLQGAGPGIVNNNAGNSRQVPSGSQPFISGLGNSQPMHPHMSLVQQQAMYGLGPRLPLSAIHPSSSGPTMFNATQNSQPSFGHAMVRPVPGTKSGLG